MKRKNIKHWGLFITLQLITLSLFAQGPNNTGTYYLRVLTERKAKR